MNKKMELTKSGIEKLDSKFRIKLINSLSGYRSVHLIGSKDLNDNTNVAIFNSVNHIGANPALMSFIMRPTTVERHTYSNIIETGYFTINHVHKSFLKKAHYTSAKFKKNISEFDVCNLEEEFKDAFPNSPFVKESNIQIGLKLVEEIEIKSNNTILIVGEIHFINIKKDIIESDGQLDYEKTNNICITGLNQYSSVTKFVNFPYARVSELPNFSKKERPDNVSFDNETQSYNASILPYGTNIGAPSIETKSLSNWKNNSINSFNHLFEDKIEELKENYKSLIEEYKINELIYNAKHSFEPVIGKEYHLYESSNIDNSFLSLIPPTDWNKKHLGTFILNHEKVWKRIDK